MVLITEGYRRLNAKLHQIGRGYGSHGSEWATQVTALRDRYNAQSVLDYGCGKSSLAKNLDYSISQYDPAIPGKDSPPEPADLVVCTDVLEHVEPECLDDVLDHLSSLTTKVIFLVISLRPAKKVLADGRNAHLIVREGEWWREKIETYFKLDSINSSRDEMQIVGERNNVQPHKNLYRL